MAPKRVYDCYCISVPNHLSINRTSLCYKHMLNRFNSESMQDVIETVLKPINFVIYHDKFVLIHCYDTDYKDIVTDILLRSIDRSIYVGMRLYNKRPFNGFIISNRRYIYEIHSNLPRWMYYTPETAPPNLDPIKKHLRDLIVQDHNDYSLLRSGYRRI